MPREYLDDFVINDTGLPIITDGGIPVIDDTPIILNYQLAAGRLTINSCAPFRAYDCRWLFSRLRVRPSFRHTTLVEWVLNRSFDEEGPYQFQLQVSYENVADDCAWRDVGGVLENVTAIEDPVRRSGGHVQRVHYRVKMLTPAGNRFYSPARSTWGDLPFRYQRIAEARMRTWRVQLERTFRGQSGYLLKRKLELGHCEGRPVLGQGILDYQTEEIVNPQAPETIGTAVRGGYYRAIHCMADLGEIQRDQKLEKLRGTMNESVATQATFLGVPQLDAYDIWVDADTDFRWEVRNLVPAESVQSYPIAMRAVIHLLPFSHPIYKIYLGQDSGVPLEITSDVQLPFGSLDAAIVF